MRFGSYIERNELLQPQGLAAYVRAAFERSAADEAIPDIAVNKEAWYRYAAAAHRPSEGDPFFLSLRE